MRWNMHLPLGIAIGFTMVFLLSSLDIVQNFTSIRRSVNEHSNPNSEQIEQDFVIPTMSAVDDRHFHTDDDKVVQDLIKKVRVLVWVMPVLTTKAIALKDTWGKRVDKLLFLRSNRLKLDPKLPMIIFDENEGSDHQTDKTMKGFKYIYDHHLDDADWFMKAGEDTYVITENLRYFLSNENHSAPIYFGHHFNPFAGEGQCSGGGGGYVLSKEALRRLGTTGMDPRVCRQDGKSPDLDFEHCMDRLGVRIVSSNDVLDRSRFHCFTQSKSHNFHYWHYFDAKKGLSDYAISFQRVPLHMMKTLEFSIYHLRPYGFKAGLQDLNVKH